MNNSTVSNIVRFVFLVLLQVFIFSNVNFMGYVNPYLYILFVILLPVNLNQAKVLFYSFLLGLSIDFFQDSGGIHAAACLVIAYLRPLILRFSFGITYEHQTMKFRSTAFSERFVYILCMVFFHHLVLFSLEVFNFDHFILVLKKAAFSGIFSMLLIIFTIILFGKKST